MTGQQIIKRFDTLKEKRSNWESLWQESADWCWPTNDNINAVRTAGAEKPPQRMIDTCVEANLTFASGFFANMFPPNVVWANYRHPDPAMMDQKGVADYFEEVSRIIYQLLLKSNFSTEEFQALLAMGAFGTNCLSVEEDEDNVFRFRNFTIGRIVVEEDNLGRVDTVGREFTLTARQAVQQFGVKNLDATIVDDANEHRDNKHMFVHLVSPRADYKVGSKRSDKKPIASYYVCRKTQKIVKEGGFDNNPYKVSRFTKGNDEVYGRGPMSMCLATARRANVIFRSAIVSAEQHSNPQWLLPDDDSVKGLSSRAGAKIKWRTSNPNGKPERLDHNGDPGIAMDMYELHDAQIKRMFYNHLFRPLDDYRNMTAYEANVREQTDMLALTPFVSRYLDEHVSPIMETVYYMAAKANKLPAPPAALNNDPSYEVDYIGRLSMASKGLEARGSVDTIRIMAELAQGVPQLAESFDYIDGDKLLKVLNHANSGVMRVLKDADVVEEERIARAEAMEKQKQIENAPALADAAQKISGPVAADSILEKLGEQ